MKLIDMQCTKCGSTLQVNPELSKCICQYCGNEMLIDQEVQKHEVNVQGNVNMTGGFEFGYQQQMGVMKAMMEEQQRQSEFNAKAESAKKQYNTCQVFGIICLICSAIKSLYLHGFIIFVLILLLVDANKLLKQKEELESKGINRGQVNGLAIGLFIVMAINIYLVIR